MGRLGYCIRCRDVLVVSDAYAAESPLSFPYRHIPPMADPASYAVTPWPALTSARIAASPDIPPPITQTSRLDPVTRAS
jgi:hypothetical protein